MSRKKSKNFETFSSTDGLLLRDFKSGRIEAFDKIVFTYKNKIFGICKNLLDDEGKSLNIAIEVFANLYKSVHEFDGATKFTPWLYRLAIEDCIKKLPRSRRREINVEKYLATSDKVDSIKTPPEFLKKVHKKIGIKPPKDDDLLPTPSASPKPEPKTDTAKVRNGETAKRREGETKKPGNHKSSELGVGSWEKKKKGLLRTPNSMLRTIPISSILKGMAVVVACILVFTVIRAIKQNQKPYFDQRIPRPPGEAGISRGKIEGPGDEIKNEIKQNMSEKRVRSGKSGKTLTGNWDRPEGLPPGEMVILGERIDKDTARRNREEMLKREREKKYKRYGHIKMRGEGGKGEGAKPLVNPDIISDIKQTPQKPTPHIIEEVAKMSGGRLIKSDEKSILVEIPRNSLPSFTEYIKKLTDNGLQIKEEKDYKDKGKALIRIDLK